MLKRYPHFFAGSVFFVLSAQAELITQDSFDEPESYEPPEAWVSDEPGKDHARVTNGSLYFAGLSESQGNRLLLGHSPADYNFSFLATDLAYGETIYFSFLVRNEVITSFGDGSPMVRLSHREDKHGSGVSIGHGNREGDPSLMAFSINNRNRGYDDKDAVRTEENLPVDGTYLIVGAYTLGSGKHDGKIQLWVNPNQLGAAQSPAPTLEIDTYQHDPVWDQLTIRTNGSSSHPDTWSIDEVRIGTSWAAVTPTGDTKWIPEPKTYSLVFGLLALLALGIRGRK